MDPLSNKINKKTIKFANKTYKKLSTLQCERTYSSHYNHYDEKIDNNIDKIYYLLDEIYQASIEKKAVNDMELYDSDSDIPDIQGTFDECITPRTPREVNKPSTPSAPVKPGKKIIVEEESEEDIEVVSEEESEEDLDEDNVEEDKGDVLSHIMGYSDGEESDDSDDSYEKISDEEGDKPVICRYKKHMMKVETGKFKKGEPYKVQNGFFKNGKPKYKIEYTQGEPIYKTICVQGEPIYKKVSANESINDIEQLSLEESLSF